MKPVTLPVRQPGHLWTGLVEAAFPLAAARQWASVRAPVTLFVGQSLREVEQGLEDLLFFLRAAGMEPPDARVLPTPPRGDPEDPRVFEAFCDRVAVLTRLLDRGKVPVVIGTTLEGLFEPCPPPEQVRGGELRLRVGEEQPYRALVDRLGRQLNYASEAVCESPGEFAVRGGLIDVYPLNATQPYRIDFFGDEVESIRSFDPTTQRSLDAVSDLVIASGQDAIAEAGRSGGLAEYLPGGTLWLLVEPARLEREHPDRFQEPDRHKTPRPTLRTFTERPDDRRDCWVGLCEVHAPCSLFPDGFPEQFSRTESLRGYRHFPEDNTIGADRFASEQSARKAFLQQLLAWQADGHHVAVVCQNEGEQQRLEEILRDDVSLRALNPAFLRGPLQAGFRIDPPDTPETVSLAGPGHAGGEVIVTDGEIFGRQRRRMARLRRRNLPTRSQVDQMLDFSELADGDPLVHLQHGICLYRGLTRMDLRGRNEEVISLEFAESVQLHVPLHESHLLTRYVGLSRTAPKLGKLGSGAWDRTRRAAERATIDFASELLNLQARRDSQPGYAFGEDTAWQREFEESFPYRETPDQHTAILATKEDMEKERPMDRLVCGDVGFGKTEVAIRAAFKAVQDGKQVAVLVPTTVLSQQHFNTFGERMADYPIVVEMLSRFRTDRQARAILQDVAAGRIDILIGTHRILSADVVFRDLGLLVIDEEQRFGVAQKEQLKQLRAFVDIMTLSATPIPRTLYQALVGAREMSVIETPPMDRLPIQTVVRPYDEELVRRAVQAELDRGGQVFYLHNRVGTIDRVAGKLEELIPRARIAVGHGQMDEGMLERVMTRFVAGAYDVLVCTTIIESGLDIPNCNTIIIEGADKFGLAQLYQLRGRVGRFKRQAFAYLLLHRKTHVQDQARKRLSALQQYNQLGAGYRIAMRDLELRGAGNLLGTEQSGHIAGVGFDLYCQLLRQSIAKLKGDPEGSVIRANLRLDFVVVGEGEGSQVSRSGPAHAGFRDLRESELAEEQVKRLAAFIPESYLGESRLRIDTYRQLAMATTPEAVTEVETAMVDRFGQPPEPVTALLQLTRVRCLAEQRRFDLVESEGSRLKCRFAESGQERYLKTGTRFPRLTRKNPFARLKEIESILKRVSES
ncbi:MAG: transcription-repair coupling factor [Opitutales bacterium]